MILRWLTREFREFPATSFLCIAWILVFAAMTYTHLASGAHLSPSGWLIYGFGGGDRYGDLTLHDLARGQVWRLVTCNFVHYSVIHIVLNLLALYQLGSIVESWYGPHQLIFLYGLTGACGNLLSAMCRMWARSGGEVHSAGGSVVIMGLVGLCTVAGWHSRNPDGRWLSKVMLLFIVLTAVLGMLFPRFIDNWGHAGGLVVGAAIGLAHRRLLASVRKPSAWGAGVLTGFLIAGSAAAQFVVDRRESPVRTERSLVQRSGYLVGATAELNQLRRAGDRRHHAAVASKWLEVLDSFLDGPGRTELQGLRPLLDAAKVRELTEEEARVLDERLTHAIAAIRRNYEQLRTRLHQLRSRK